MLLRKKSLTKESLSYFLIWKLEHYYILSNVYHIQVYITYNLMASVFCKPAFFTALTYVSQAFCLHRKCCSTYMIFDTRILINQFGYYQISKYQKQKLDFCNSKFVYHLLKQKNVYVIGHLSYYTVWFYIIENNLLLRLKKYHIIQPEYTLFRNMIILDLVLSLKRLNKWKKNTKLSQFLLKYLLLIIMQVLIEFWALQYGVR